MGFNKLTKIRRQTWTALCTCFYMIKHFKIPTHTRKKYPHHVNFYNLYIKQDDAITFCRVICAQRFVNMHPAPVSPIQWTDKNEILSSIQQWFCLKLDCWAYHWFHSMIEIFYLIMPCVYWMYICVCDMWNVFNV